MGKYFFWRSWRLPERVVYQLGLIAFMAAAVWLSAAYYFGRDAVIDWEKEGEVQTIDFTLSQPSKNLFSFDLQAPTYLVVERFKASGLRLSTSAHQLYLAATVTGTVFLLMAASGMSLTWFFVIIAATSLHWGALGLDQLGVFRHFSNQYFIAITILAYSGLATLFRFALKANLLVQALTYSALSASLGFFIQSESAIDAPFMFMAGRAYAIPLVFSVFFIMLTAHEIVRLFFFIATYPRRAGNTTQRLIIITALYLVGLAYSYFYLSKTVDLGISYLEPFFLLLPAGVLGIWGFGYREPQYKGIMDFAPSGALLYIGLGIVAFAQVALSLTNANDPLTEVFEDVILLSFLGFGAGFLLYLYANFKDLMDAGQPAYKVTYKPLKFDYYYSLFVALIVIGAFLANNNFFMKRQAYAGYFNTLADWYYFVGNDKQAKQHYSVASGYAPSNHRSQYSLGVMAEAVNDYGAASVFYDNAIFKSPSPYAYAKLSDLHLRNRKYFEAIFALKEGLKAFPEEGQLMNNLALLFNKTDMADSVLIYFEQARQYSEQPKVVEANMFALWTKLNLFSQLEEVYDGQAPLPYVGTYANELAFLNKLRKPGDRVLQRELLQDSLLNTQSLCYLYNFALNELLAPKENFLSEPFLEAFAQSPSNFQFKPFLDFAQANIFWEKGEVGKALRLMESVIAQNSQMEAAFVHYLGVWQYTLGNYSVSAQLFEEAVARGAQEDLFYQALALSELPESRATARALWERLTGSQADPTRQFARTMLEILGTTWQDAANKSWDEADWYRFLHYQGFGGSTQQFITLAEHVENDSWKAQLFAEQIMRLSESGRNEAAGQLLTHMAGSRMMESNVNFFGQAYLFYHYKIGVFKDDFAEKVNSVTLPKSQTGWKPFYLAQFEAGRRQDSIATAYFEKAIAIAPYETEFFIAYSDFYFERDLPSKAYEVLLKGVRQNERSPELLEAYIIACGKLGYDAFAQEALATYSSLVDEATYTFTVNRYEKALSAGSAQDPWEAELP